MDTTDNLIEIDTSWTLFLDRDGIINVRPEGYITKWKDFVFKKDFEKSITELSRLFTRIIVITNQQGVGKGLMAHSAAEDIHSWMVEAATEFGGRIDSVYFCPHLADDNCSCRKPLTGMGLMAKNDYPEIDFNKSVMVGDTARDMVFGRSLGMKTVYIPSREEDFSCYDYFASDLTEAIKIFRKY
jgi:D-glycero-D-manno-heptose 1,7-bisphosphate phosphatase